MDTTWIHHLQYMKKAARLHNLREGENTLEMLVALDFAVHQFSEYHFRINGRLDVWPTSRKYYDIKSHQKGTYHDLERLAKDLFAENGL